jgi:HEAT repeat protein
MKIRHVYLTAWWAVPTLLIGCASSIGKDAKPAAVASVDQKVIAYDFGQSRLPLSGIEDEIRQAKPEQYPAIEMKLIAILDSSDATFASKQFACRELQIVGSAASVPALGRFLSDEKLADMARFALEPMADPAAGAALRDALPKVKGKLLVGVISSIGQRRDGPAVAALSEFANSTDRGVVSAAIRSLGNIGTNDAAASLAKLAATAPKPMQRTIAGAQLVCARHLAEEGKTAAAATIYTALNDAQYSLAIHVAALEGLIATQDHPGAVKLICGTLEAGDADLMPAALAAVNTGGGALQNAIAEKLPSLKPNAQLALLGVLNYQSEVALRPALLRVLQESSDDQLRVAALEGMALHGQAADVSMLVKLVAKDIDPESAAARKALEQMGHRGVDEMLIQLAAGSGNSTERVVVLRLLTNRRAETAMPPLVKLIMDVDTNVAVEAIKALGSLGGADQLAPLSSLVLDTTDGSIRDGAANAIKSICGRTTDKQACTTVIVPAIDRAKNNASRIALVRVLSRIGGEPALAAAQKAIGDKDAEVADAAMRELADWPDKSAAAQLLGIARSTKNQTHAVLAMRGYLRLAAMKDQPADERLAMYRNALVAAQPAEKRQALAGVAEIPTPASLDLIQGYLKNPSLKNEAAIAAIKLARQLAAAYNQLALAVLNDLKAAAGSDEAKKQADEAIAFVEKVGRDSEGFILTWMMAGPYTQRNKTGSALFDIALGPEKGDAVQVNWRPAAAAAADSQTPWIVDLAKLIGGDQRVAYLKTTITSDKSKDALLELGSDDGIKVWLNGQVVHANNAERGISPGQDKVKVHLNQGSNLLLMKITQGGSDWAACARLRTPDGGKLDGVVVTP